jgi:hypothetical protein
VNDNEVTGGELYSLWRVANINLPRVQAAYTEAANAVHEVDVADEKKFGATHPAWASLAAVYEQLLFVTAGSMLSVSYALKEAIDAFEKIDGSLADKLKDVIDSEPDTKLHGDEIPGELQVPNYWND